MKKKFLWRISIIVAACVLSLIFFLPTTSLRSVLPEWLNQYGITLGLDLQGGVHLVYEVDGDKAIDVTIERIAASLTNIFNEKKIEGVKVDKQDRDIIISPDSDEVINIVRDEYPNLVKHSGPGGSVVFRFDDSEIARLKDYSVDQALETIRNRVDQFGVAEPDIHRQAKNEIVIQLPGVKDAKRAIELVGKTAILEFKLLDEESQFAAQLPGAILPGKEKEILDLYADQIPEGDEILFGKVIEDDAGNKKRGVYLIKKQTLLTGDLLTEARVTIDQRQNEPVVTFALNPTGAKLFDQITTANVKKLMAIILDNNVYSAPRINERIPGGSGVISGYFGLDEARDLAIVLRSGSLPAPMNMLQNVTVGPSLGKDSINAGIKAGLIGAFLVIVFMIAYYKMAGVIANFALALNIVYLVGILSAFSATLTLPGIAGVILAIGMAVDSNVLMFERIREELRVGKTPRAAIDSGYDKAFWTIFDSHVTTLITAIVLFQFGTGPIKGFAVTLGWGVFINLFTALVGTKTIFDLISSRKEMKELSI